MQIGRTSDLNEFQISAETSMLRTRGALAENHYRNPR